MREMERSLKLLHTDRIDLMLHHNLGDAKELDQVAGPNGAEQAIRKLQDQKVVRFRGFSCHDPALTLRAIARLEPDAHPAADQRHAGPRLRGRRAAADEGEGHRGRRHEGGRPRVLPERRHRRRVRLAVRKPTSSPELHRFAPPADAFTRPVPTPAEYLRYAMSLPVTTVLAGMDSLATLNGLHATASGFSQATAAEADDIRKRAQVFSGTGYWIPRRG